MSINIHNVIILDFPARMLPHSLPAGQSDLFDGLLRLKVATRDADFKDMNTQTLRADGAFAVVDVADAAGIRLPVLTAADRRRSTT